VTKAIVLVKQNKRTVNTPILNAVHPLYLGDTRRGVPSCCWVTDFSSTQFLCVKRSKGTTVFEGNVTAIFPYNPGVMINACSHAAFFGGLDLIISGAASTAHSRGPMAEVEQTDKRFNYASCH
jgi:hypothetical protein